MENHKINDECFAITQKGCSALTDMKCDGCSFYKTTEQIGEERDKSIKRLKELGLFEQVKEKYGF